MITYLKTNSISYALSRHLRTTYVNSDTVFGKDTFKYLQFYLLPGPLVDFITKKQKKVPGIAVLGAELI